MKNRKFKIAILLPTYQRTDALSRSLFSLIDHAEDLDSIQFILGIDDNDDIALNYFSDVIQPKLDQQDINYTAITFEPLGYQGLNRYFNTLATYADADWLFVWCDDAIMNTTGWDARITECTGEFKLLKVHTHNEHPYSIFPIIPAEWHEITGHLSRHQLIDNEVSQLAYMFDIMKIIEVDVTHDRSDLTGNNDDENAKKKQYFEGNPNDPRDFHHPTFIQGRHEDHLLIHNYMEKNNLDLTWYKNVAAGKQDPWQRMIENDPNKQTMQFNTVIDPITGQKKMVPR